MTAVTALLAAGTPAELDEIAALLDHPLWRPMSLPQMEALLSPADVTGYGGAAGGGKTDWLLGVALTQHRRAILYRREATQLEGLEERALELIGERSRYNATKKLWRLPDDRLLRFGAVKEPESWKKYAGQGFDLIGFDEATHFLPHQVRTLMTWNRTPVPGQRCRVCLGFNPPTRPEEEWIVAFFAPWLDEHHPNPARPGELRWFAQLEDGEVERPDEAPFEHQGRTIRPRSRTFIPARVEDNAFLTATGYVDVLNALPEPLRSLMRDGNFAAAQTDDAWQVVPTDWVKQAQARWRADGANGRPMDSLGADIARGGRDRTVLTPRHGPWFGPQSGFPGAATPDGPAAAGMIVALLRDAAPVHVDIIGVGGAVFDFLASNRIHAVAVNGSERSMGTDRSGKLRFLNKRAELYWTLREALDPVLGHNLALPPDRELLADLCAPRWKLTANGIQVEAKDDLIKRLGRSPDKGDSLVLALMHTPKRRPGGAGGDFAVSEYDPYG